MDTDTFNKVNTIFSEQGVPSYVWYPIAQMESGGDPNAVGDNGASIGLFQLNTVGGQGIGYNPGYLKDPVVNAEVASRAIVPAYRAIADQYSPATIAGAVAVRSGHPGGSVDHPLTGAQANAAIARANSIAKSFLSGATAAKEQVQTATQATGGGGLNIGGVQITNPLDALGQQFAGVNQFFAGLSETLASFDVYGALLVATGVVILLLVIATSLASWSVSEASPLRQYAAAAGAIKGV